MADESLNNAIRTANDLDSTGVVDDLLLRKAAAELGRAGSGSKTATTERDPIDTVGRHTALLSIAESKIKELASDLEAAAQKLENEKSLRK